MLRKLLTLTAVLPLFLGLDHLPLSSQGDVLCDIGVTVKDSQGNPVANTPVKLIALDFGNVSRTQYTNSAGYTSFDMIEWPTQCENPPCQCPATWNAGNYRATAVDYCRSTDFYYSGYHKGVTITVGIPCQGPQ